MTRSTRLLALVEALRGRDRPATARELAAEFNLSERTLYRDLAALKALGAAVEGAPGLGYVLRPGHHLPPLMLDAEEADAVMLGLRFVRRAGDAGLARAARRAAGKLAAVLPEGLAERARLSGLVVAPRGGDLAAKGHEDGDASNSAAGAPGTDVEEQATPAGPGATLALVRAALAAERRQRLRYQDAHGTITERTVWPVALGFFEGVEVLAAWCEMREAFRHFRLDRIEALEPLPDRSPRPRRRLLAEYRAIEPGLDL